MHKMVYHSQKEAAEQIKTQQELISAKNQQIDWL